MTPPPTIKHSCISVYPVYDALHGTTQLTHRLVLAFVVGQFSPQPNQVAVLVDVVPGIDRGRSQAMSSSGYEGFILSDPEYRVRSYHDALRALIPVMTLESPPAADALKRVNAEMSQSGPANAAE